MNSTTEILAARILIVDDQESNILLLETLLSNFGYTHVHSTMNPVEVSSLHRDHPFDLILLDLQMPLMDGFQVLAELKANVKVPQVPVMVLTAQPAHKLQAFLSGAQDFISKPFDLMDLKNRIRTVLEMSKARFL